jgi:hypothetical protein
MIRLGETAYFSDGQKMYTTIFQCRFKWFKELWIMWVHRNDIEHPAFPQFYRHKGFCYGMTWGRLTFAKSENRVGCL